MVLIYRTAARKGYLIEEQGMTYLADPNPESVFWVGYGVIHEFVNRHVDEWDDTWWAWAILTIALVMFEYWLFEPRSPPKPLSDGER